MKENKNVVNIIMLKPRTWSLIPVFFDKNWKIQGLEKIQKFFKTISSY